MKYYQPVFFRGITDSFPEIQEAAYYLRQMLDNAVISEAPVFTPSLPTARWAPRLLHRPKVLMCGRDAGSEEAHTDTHGLRLCHANARGHTHIIAEVHTHICRYRNRDTYTQIQTQIHTLEYSQHTHAHTNNYKKRYTHV